MTGIQAGEGRAREGDVESVVGRADEQARLRSIGDRAAAGTPQLVVIEGPAGVGKSALVRDLATAMPAGHVALWARGEQIERQLDFGIIDQLVREAGAAGLAAPPALLRSEARPDPLEVGQTILDLTEQYGTDRLLLIVVDDAQWADLASIQAMSFAYRRLHQRRVLVVVVQRPDAPTLEAFDRLVRDGRGHRLRLAPLSPTAVAALVHARIGVHLTPRAAARLHGHTAGSPLETITLVDELDPGELTSGIGPLPAPRSYASLVLARLAACSPDAEQLVSMVAITGVPVELPTLARMAGVDDAAAALSEAIERDLLSLDRRGGRRVVEVAHPLIRAAVVEDLSPARAGQLHALAARTVDDPDRALLHRLRAVVGDDHDLAAEAIRRAGEQFADGWALTGVELLVAASDVLPPGAERSEARMRAARWLLRAGDTAAARELLDGTSGSDQPLERLVRGELALLEGDDRAARRLLEEAWAAEPALEVGARAAGLLATISANHGRPGASMRWARRALEQGTRSGTDVGYAMTMLASGWALDGDLDAGSAEIESWAARLSGGAGREDTQFARGAVALWAGRLDEAEELLRSVADNASKMAPLLTVAGARYSLADVWFRLGRWDEALALAEDLARSLEDSGQLLSAPMAHGVAASVRAARGDLAVARRHVEAGRAAMDATRNGAARLWVSTAEARVAGAADEHERVVGALQPLADALRDIGLPEGVQPWRADLVDALVALGRLDEAAAELGDLDARLATGGAHARAGAARARGNLAAACGDAPAAATAFAAGLAGDARVAGPFVRARLELAAGEFERRRGQRRDAAALLDAAEGRFELLGAAPLLARTRRERANCGLRPRRNATGCRDLTESERSVAELVASGHTNREVARALVVSVKTVETHLTRVFDKLAVRSRTELANAWRDERPDGSPLT